MAVGTILWSRDGIQLTPGFTWQRFVIGIALGGAQSIRECALHLDQVGA